MTRLFSLYVQLFASKKENTHFIPWRPTDCRRSRDHSSWPIRTIFHTSPVNVYFIYFFVITKHFFCIFNQFYKEHLPNQIVFNVHFEYFLNLFPIFLKNVTRTKENVYTKLFSTMSNYVYVT